MKIYPLGICVRRRLCFAIAVGWVFSAYAHTGAAARAIVAIVHDQSIRYVAGEMQVLEQAGAGSVTLLDCSSSPVRARHLEGIPASVVGAPTSIAVHPTRDLALVTSAMRPGSVDGKRAHVQDVRISLIGWSGERMQLIASIEAGLQPSGVCFSPDGTFALVANRGDGSVSILETTSLSVTERKRVPLCRADDSLSHIEISPDGSRALATLNKSNEVLWLKVEAGGELSILARAQAGEGPYAARFFPDGRRAAVASIWTDDVRILEFPGDRIEVVERLAVGRIPEGIEISPDGTRLAVSCLEGTNLTDSSHPKYGQTGRVHLFAKRRAGFEALESIEVKGGPQFAVFSPDGGTLVVAETGARQLALFERSKGEFWRKREGIAVPGEPVAAIRSP